LVDFYENDDVYITANSGSVSFVGSQVVIDVTGEANGQLKRIEERVCTSSLCGESNAGESSPAALRSDECIYKQYLLYYKSGSGINTQATTPSSC
jgi:hypothetical protein